MSKRDVGEALARWLNPAIKRKEEKIEVVLMVLEELGFEIRLSTTGHYVVKHERLRNAGFAGRVITISQHAHGKPGFVPKKSVQEVIDRN